MIPLALPRQPVGPARLAWWKPICKGLVSAIDFRTLRDVAQNNRTPSNTSGEPSPGIDGLGQNYSTSTWASWGFNRGAIGNQVSSFMLYDKTTGSGGNGFIFGDVQLSGVGYNWGLYSNNSNFLFFVKCGGTGVSATSTTAANVAQRVAHLGIYTGAAVELWLNGARQGTAAQSGNVDAGSFDLSVNRWNSSAHHNIKPAIALAWNRALSPAEAFSISKNPWQVWEDEDDDLLFPALSIAAGSFKPYWVRPAARSIGMGVR